MVIARTTHQNWLCGGASLPHNNHAQHFGSEKVYLVCILIWVVSSLSIIPDVMEVGNSIYLKNDKD